MQLSYELINAFGLMHFVDMSRQSFSYTSQLDAGLNPFNLTACLCWCLCHLSKSLCR